MFNCLKIAVKRTAVKKTLYSKDSFLRRNFSDFNTKELIAPPKTLDRFKHIFTPEGFEFAKEVVQLFDKHFPDDTLPIPNSFRTSVATDELGTKKVVVSTDCKPIWTFIASRDSAVHCLDNFQVLKFHSVVDVAQILRELDHFMGDNESIKSLMGDVKDGLGRKILACIKHYSRDGDKGKSKEINCEKVVVVDQLTDLLNKVVTAAKDDLTVWEWDADDNENDDDDEKKQGPDENYEKDDDELLLEGLYDMLRARIEADDATPEKILRVAKTVSHAARNYNLQPEMFDDIWIVDAIVRFRDHSELSTVLLECFAEVYWDNIYDGTKDILVGEIEHMLVTNPTEQVVVAASRAVVRTIQYVEKPVEVGLNFISAYNNVLTRGGSEMKTAKIDDAMWKVLRTLTQDDRRLFLKPVFETALGKSVESLKQNDD